MSSIELIGNTAALIVVLILLAIAGSVAWMVGAGLFLGTKTAVRWILGLEAEVVEYETVKLTVAEEEKTGEESYRAWLSQLSRTPLSVDAYLEED